MSTHYFKKSGKKETKKIQACPHVFIFHHFFASATFISAKRNLKTKNMVLPRLKTLYTPFYIYNSIIGTKILRRIIGIAKSLFAPLGNSTLYF